MKRVILLLLIALVAACASRAQTFTLEASHGQTVEHEFGSGLISRLAANRDPVTPGWTIEVLPKGEKNPEVELGWPVNPPYRGWNPTVLDVSYGYTAAQALQMNTRQFSFIRDPADYARTAQAVRSLLWSYGIAQQQLDQSRRILDEVAKCTVTVRIIDGRLGKHSVTPLAPAERIERLKVEVEVELCKPVPGASTP
jgi:hypothetical protein